MKWNALDCERVIESPANILQQDRGTWNKIWNAVVELVNMEKRIRTHIDKFLNAHLGFVPIHNGRNAIFSGCSHLYTVTVGEGVLERGNTEYSVFHKTSVRFIPTCSHLGVCFSCRHWGCCNVCCIMIDSNFGCTAERLGYTRKNQSCQSKESYSGGESQQVSVLGNLHFFAFLLQRYFFFPRKRQKLAEKFCS